jgi:hypothetical protein
MDGSERRRVLARSNLMPTRARLSLGRNSPGASTPAENISLPMRGVTERWKGSEGFETARRVLERPPNRLLGVVGVGTNHHGITDAHLNPFDLTRSKG